MSLAAPRLHRLHSLDQFRGYTVAAMFVVNFAGGYLACPAILRHHNDYCSFADTIMPSFLFVVGFAFRLTFERRVQHEGVRAAYARVIRRLSGLVLVSLVIYAPAAPADTWDALRNMGLVEALDPVLKRDWCQTLMHIALTSLWITPVIRASARTRVLWLLLSAAAHVVLSWWFNFDWCNTSPMAIDGGPLGFLTWSIPALVGTLACDAFMRSQGRPDLRTLTMSALCLMGCGWLMSFGTRLYDVPASRLEQLRDQKLADDPVWPGWSRLHTASVDRLTAEPPFVPPPDTVHRKWNYWMMSQRAGTLSYLTFGAGFSLGMFLLFHIACDVRKLQLPLFRTLGTNALAAYIVHMLVDAAVSPFVPRDSPAWYVGLAFILFFGVTWLIVRTLESNGVSLRI